METKIKTVYWRANLRDEFDDEVNELLASGWKLGRMEVITNPSKDKYTMLFALLFKQKT